MRFYYVYKALAHPELNGYVQPFTLEERLMHVREAERTLGSQIPWLCDTMQNDLKHALGDAPNSEFLIDSDGRVARKRAWSDPEQLRADLEELVGPVETPTRAEDLNLKVESPPKVAASGIVERIPRSRAMRALKVEPQQAENGPPFYVKVRAEADQSLLRDGSGQVYLGFHLDPLYKVHWNNLTKPIRIEIRSPAGVQVSPAVLEGPKVEAPVDVDPREFLVKVEAEENRGPLRLTVSYFACNDEEDWCRAVRQEYAVRLEADPDGGWVRPSGDRRDRPLRPPVGERGAGRTAFGRVRTIAAEERLLVVRAANGDDREFRVPEGARIVRDREPAELEDVRPGDMVRLQYEPADEGRPAVARMMVRTE